MNDNFQRAGGILETQDGRVLKSKTNVFRYNDDWQLNKTIVLSWFWWGLDPFMTIARTWKCIFTSCRLGVQRNIFNRTPIRIQGKLSLKTTAGGKLPLSFIGQPLACPLAELARIRPWYMYNWMVHPVRAKSYYPTKASILDINFPCTILSSDVPNMITYWKQAAFRIKTRNSILATTSNYRKLEWYHITFSHTLPKIQKLTISTR